MHCVKASETLYVFDEFKRVSVADKNDDCTSPFEKGGDENDVASAAKTILSIACNTVYKRVSEKIWLLLLIRFPIQL